jgi:hypothetical protein
VRLITTLLWLLAALLWAPWALLVLRWLLDLALVATPLGHSFAASSFTGPVLDLLLVQFRWPEWYNGHLVGGYFIARIGSLYPWCALAACGLTALGWRLYWINEEGLIDASAGLVALSILVPPVAPLLMYRDARRRFLRAERELAAARLDAQRRLERFGP